MTKRKKSAHSEPSKELTAYSVFFSNCARKGLVKSWQEKEIGVFFKDLGLSDKETEDTYADALAKY